MKAFLLAASTFFMMNAAHAVEDGGTNNSVFTTQNCVDANDVYKLQVGGWAQLSSPNVALTVTGYGTYPASCKATPNTDEPSFICTVSEGNGYSILLSDQGDGTVIASLQDQTFPVPALTMPCTAAPQSR